jgi:LPXTG-site transpeptidase (sortase) family protein
MPNNTKDKTKDKVNSKDSTQKAVAVNGIVDEAAAAAMSSKSMPAKGKTKTKKPVRPVHPKARMTFRHNVLPPVLGILIFLSILGLLNAQWVVAQYDYHFTKPVSDISYSTAPATTNPNAPAHIYIPNISVSAPLVTDTRSYDPPTVQLALRRGPVEYGASADPGQVGNVVIIGHSSGVLWEPGNYKFVFTLLNKLVKNDRILIDFKGKRYIYRVDSSTVVPPTDISVLQPTTKPQLTLITCTPVGTSTNRLVVTAHQVSPNPATDTAAAVHPVATSAIPN